MVVISAGDIACAAGARPAAIERFMHGGQNEWMLSHSKVVVRAPDRHFLFPAVGMENCARKPADSSLQIGEYSVPPLLAQVLDPLAKIRVIIHEPPAAGIDPQSISRPLA